MLSYIDNQLNKITTYRLVLYYLIFLAGTAVLFSAAGLLPYDVFALLLSIGFLLGASWITNRVFSVTFGMPANVESVYISALILALIITPLQSLNDLWFMGWAAVLAMASKYVVAIRGKHLFNPVAFAVALTYFAINQSASWWIGSGALLPAVLIGGLLVVRKLGRFDLAISFLVSNISITWLASLFNGIDPTATVRNAILYSPLVFFAAVILTEPLTTPPTRKLRIYYGVLVGFLSIPELHFGSFYLTPELAILIGNLYAYLVSPNTRLILKLKEKKKIAPEIYEFVFAPERKVDFKPGQYMEWTLGHQAPDSRGNRRYFTLASSPTEQHLRLGIKFDQSPSTFKQALLSMNRDTEIVASQIMGDFVLPTDRYQKCVFLGGGIGVTPFRSMIKYLLDVRQRRPITLLYSARTVADIVYKDIFDRAEKELGIRVIYTLTDDKAAASQSNNIGRINPQTMRSLLPDYRNSIFFISGSRGLVDSYKDTLHTLGIPNSQIRTDSFAGLA